MKNKNKKIEWIAGNSFKKRYKKTANLSKSGLYTGIIPCIILL